MGKWSKIADYVILLLSAVVIIVSVKCLLEGPPADGIRSFWLSTPNNFIYHYQTLIAAIIAIIAAVLGGKYIKDGIIFESRYKKKEHLQSVLYFLQQIQESMKGYLTAFRNGPLTNSIRQRKLGYAVSTLEWGLTEMNACLNIHDHYEIRHHLNLPHSLLEELRMMHHEGNHTNAELVQKLSVLVRRLEKVEKITIGLLD